MISKEIYSVDWRTLQHAYGPASDVPDQLLALSSSDLEERKNALNALYGNIWNQGTVFEATLAAIPFLSKIAREADTCMRPELIDLLVAIAIGCESDLLPYSFDLHSLFASDRRRAPGRPVSISQAAYEAVEHESDLFFAQLCEQDVRLRVAGAFSLSWFPRLNGGLEAIRKQLSLATHDPVEQANLLLSYGLLAYHMATPVQSELPRRFLVSSDPRVRACAAICLAKTEFTKDVEEVLREASKEDSLSNQWEFVFFNDGDLQTYASEVLRAFIA